MRVGPLKALIRYPSTLSLRAKFLAINVPLVLLSTLMLFSIFEVLTYREAIQGLRQNLDDLVATQSAALANPLWNLDDTQIRLTLAAIATDSDVVGARVYDETGNAFDEVGTLGVTLPEVGLDAGIVDKGAADGSSRAVNTTRIIDVPQTNRTVARTNIVFADGDEQRIIGELVVAVTNRRVWEATRRRLVLAAFLALIVVASAVLSALFAHRRTIGIPLQWLLASITAAQRGESREPVKWESADEMGAVISAFNEMQLRKEADERELRAAHDNLEQRVEERTLEATGARDEAMRAQNQLSDAIESISEGFSLFDADDRLVVWNSRYRELMYPGVECILQSGVAFEKIIRNAAEQGHVDAAQGRADEWVKERLAQHRKPGKPHLQRRSGDRWIQVNERKTENGSTVATYTDLTELMRAEQAMRESEERLRAFYDNSPLEIYLKDKQGRFVLVNRQMENSLGMKSEEIIGKTTHDIYPKQLADEISAHDRAVLKSGRAISREYEAPSIEGTHVMVTDKFPVPSADGGIAGIGAISTDISERKERERQLSELVEKLKVARDESEAANQAKSSFLATMSHEIRTPMNSVVGMTSLLLDTGQTAEQREFTEIIRNSSDALLSIINDILDFSKIEAGKLELERQAFELRDCIQGAMDLLSGKAVEKGLELAYVLHPQTPEAIFGDMSRLRQVLVNLINNALKFTETGEVVLAVSADPALSEPPNYTLRLSVADSGIGIPADRMNRLFQPFSQVDASISRRHGGTGLGLAICKRLSELMGGNMWVESEEGKGSVFYFTIQAESVAASEYDFLHEIQPQLRMKRLLIVEDNETSRSILVEQALAWGMQPRATGSASEALDWIRRGDPFDIAIVDAHMPNMEGFELSSAIREQRDAQSLPIVMLAPLGEQEGELTELGFDAFLTKPVKPSQLFDVLINISTGTPIVPRVREKAETSTFDESMGRDFPLRILLTEDNVNNQKLALLVLSRLGYRADVAGNGIEALEALERQNYEMVLMDVQMPEMDGLEATRLIRERWPGDRKPWIIAMTANAMQGDREMCLQAGMNDYVTKPIRIEQVMTSLKKGWASLHGEMPENEAQPIQAEIQNQSNVVDHIGPAPGDKTNNSILDPKAIARLEQLAGGNQAFLIEFIDTFLSGVPKMLGEMQQSLDEGNADSLRRVAHTFKSNCAALGAGRLSELCKELEYLGKSGELGDALNKVTQVQHELEPVKSALETMRESYSS